MPSCKTGTACLKDLADKEVDDIIDNAFRDRDPSTGDALSSLGLDVLLAELGEVLSGADLNGYEWLFRGQVFDSRQWHETVSNRFVVVVRETAQFVFFVGLPHLSVIVGESAGDGAHGTERPERSVIGEALQALRSERQRGRKLSPSVNTSRYGPKFSSGGLTYSVWDGSNCAFDHRR